MRRAIFLASVRADLLAIFDYLAEMSGSISVASAFVGEVRAHCHKLAALSAKLGRARPELGDAIRSTPYKGYVIFFGYVGARFEVIAILEGHRDIDAHFSGPEDE